MVSQWSSSNLLRLLKQYLYRQDAIPTVHPTVSGVRMLTNVIEAVVDTSDVLSMRLSMRLLRDWWCIKDSDMM